MMRIRSQIIAEVPPETMTPSIPESPGREDGDKALGSVLAGAEDLEQHCLRIPTSCAGQRLDQALATLFPRFSRSRLQGWIRDGLVHVDAVPRRPRYRVWGGEWVELQAVIPAQVDCRPQPIPLQILHQDADLLVLVKPSGLVVHPATGNPDGTLQNGLLYLDPDLIRLPRCGIVHRLDKDTSGLLVVARSLHAHRSLVAQLQAHTVRREYLAVVNGIPVAGATLDWPIGRHPTQRTRMAVTRTGRPAVTHFQVQERFVAHSLLSVQLATGRTHQIRVHLAHIRFPIVGDPVYGGRLRLPPHPSEELAECLRGFRRQALHAWRLTLTHPVQGVALAWETPPPEDMQHLLELLRSESR